MARVLAEFLAARAEAGERQSTLRGYNAAVQADEDVGWIGSVVHQMHKRIAQAASKVGFQPSLPPKGLCILMERAGLQPGALPMVIWSSMVDVSLPLWLQFRNSQTGEEGWQSHPLSSWADGFREALLRWAEAKGVRASGHLFLGGSAWLEHKFLEPWRQCR